MNKYEVTIITREDLKDSPIKKEVETLSGKILSVDNVGQKQFVFPIKKETAGYYTSVIFEIPAEKVFDLNKKLSLNTDILRHLIITHKAAAITPAPKPKISMPTAKIEEPIAKVPALEPAPAREEKHEVKAKVEKPEKKEAPKRVIKEPKILPTKKPAKKTAVAEGELSTEERLKALDKKLDELLKE